MAQITALFSNDLGDSSEELMQRRREAVRSRRLRQGSLISGQTSCEFNGNIVPLYPREQRLAQ